MYTLDDTPKRFACQHRLGPRPRLPPLLFTGLRSQINGISVYISYFSNVSTGQPLDKLFIIQPLDMSIYEIDLSQYFFLFLKGFRKFLNKWCYIYFSATCCTTIFFDKMGIFHRPVIIFEES